MAKDVKKIRQADRWKKLKRTRYGIERICHYPQNMKGCNIPCYNCVDRAKCNADLYEQLAKYEDSGITPEATMRYRDLDKLLEKNGMSIEDAIAMIRQKTALTVNMKIQNGTE